MAATAVNVGFSIMRKKEMPSGSCVIGSFSATNLSDQSETKATDPTGTPIFNIMQIGEMEVIFDKAAFLNE